MGIEIERTMVKHGYLTKIDVCVYANFYTDIERIDEYLLFLKNLKFSIPKDWKDRNNIESHGSFTALQLAHYGTMDLNLLEINTTYYLKEGMEFKDEAGIGGMNHKHFLQNKEDFLCFCLESRGKMFGRYDPNPRMVVLVMRDGDSGLEKEVNLDCQDLCHKLRCIHQHYDGIMEKFFDFCSISAYIWVEKKRVLETEEGKRLCA